MEKLSSTQNIFKKILGVFLVCIGISHFIVQEEFINQVPLWLPLEYDTVVLISGAIEISLGTLLLFLPKQRIGLGWMITTYFILIFPGNISQYVNQKDAFGLDTNELRLYRLFLQPILIGWTLWATGAWDNLINNQSQISDKNRQNNSSNGNRNSNGDGHPLV